jgi:hypothetical protein
MWLPAMRDAMAWLQVIERYFLFELGQAKWI